MATWTPATKNTAAWTDPSKTFTIDKLLLESGFYMLQESLSKIILEQSDILTVWAGGTKNTASWVNSTEH